MDSVRVAREFVLSRQGGYIALQGLAMIGCCAGAVVMMFPFPSSSHAVAPAAVNPATTSACASVNCETAIVYDETEGGFVEPPPCINHGCSAGCSPGDSASELFGGGWSTCLCGGEIEPRCCHIIYRGDEEGGYEWTTDGNCSAQQSGCAQGSVCGWISTGSLDPLVFEVLAGCAF